LCGKPYCLLLTPLSLTNSISRNSLSVTSQLNLIH